MPRVRSVCILEASGAAPLRPVVGPHEWFMIHRITLAVMVGLALWVALTAVRIELLNARADFYLPRRDDGADGQWRVSLQNMPRDQLRGLIMSAGLLQYLFASLVVGLAIFHISRRESGRRRWLAFCSGVVALTALSLALYRGYYTSLGW
jgi:hypothetical protein